jgi:hypothetical protein
MILSLCLLVLVSKSFLSKETAEGKEYCGDRQREREKKMADEHPWRSAIVQPMGRLSMHAKCLDLFFWGGGGMFSIFLCSQHVHFKFPISSHQVPTYGKMEYLPVWPTYIGEKWEDFGQKHKGLKRGGIGNTLGEHIESLGKPSMVSIFFFL